jgi:N-formylglutamate amidohydrolase
MMELFTLQRGNAPLVIDVPHAGTHLPAELCARLTPQALAVPDTDWHVENLYAFAAEVEATLICATHSRYVVDLNRDPSGAVLYAGADNTELCPMRTFANAPVYLDGGEPTAADIAQRIATCFDPYHATLAAEIERVRALHGHAVVLDGHSIRSEVPRFFAGRLPDLNLGTADGTSCDDALAGRAAAVLAAAPGMTHVVNGRFKGGWITRHYGRPQAGVHALQLELGERCYMDQDPPFAWDPARAAPLLAVLRRLVQSLVAWRPRP